MQLLGALRSIDPGVEVVKPKSARIVGALRSVDIPCPFAILVFIIFLLEQVVAVAAVEVFATQMRLISISPRKFWRLLLHLLRYYESAASPG